MPLSSPASSSSGRLGESEAYEVARDLTYTLVKAAYKL